MNNIPEIEKTVPSAVSLILDQHQLNDAYGNGYSKNNGCAWIAVFNILLMSGNYMPEHEIKKMLTDMHGLILGGKFGTKPKTLYRLLKEKLKDEYLVHFHRCFVKQRMEFFSKGSEYVIITSFWYKRTRGKLKGFRAAAHTFAGRRVDDTKFEFYNETYNRKVTCTVSDLFRKKNKGSENRHTFPLSIIAIRRR